MDILNSPEFEKFYEMLVKKNEVLNLTAVTDKKEAYIKHFYDSLSSLNYLEKGAKIAEIGSGGGFPSVPLKLARGDLKFTLIESTGKKCVFLNEVKKEFNFSDFEILNIRAEDGAKNKALREKFDIATARAVAKLNTLVEYCLPFVKVGGKFIAYKGASAGEELKEAENAIGILGGKTEDIIFYDLPENLGKRALIIIDKVKKTPEKYPRGLGKERKSPL